ncbi:MAG: hypothetical protein NDF56_01035 [archaeon GB-1845-036]|nr:hypothetical protein [Candidatus Culexmicrobium thermophilum]
MKRIGRLLFYLQYETSKNEMYIWLVLNFAFTEKFRRENASSSQRQILLASILVWVAIL